MENFEKDLKQGLQQASKGITIDATQALKEIGDKGAYAFVKNKLSDINSYLQELREMVNICKVRKNSEDYSDLKDLMKLCYITIMNFRTYIVGKDQEIQYRLYALHGKNGVIVYNFDESVLMDNVIVVGDKLKLDSVNVIEKKIERLNKKDAEMTKLVAQLEGGIWAGLQQLDSGGLIANDDIIIKGTYNPKKKKNPNLVWQYPKGTVKLPKKTFATRKIFNRGWVYQAFDETVYNYFKNKEQVQNLDGEEININKKEFYTSYFRDYLRHDNVISYAGGDVGTKQVKANMAGLMSIATMIKGLEQIITIIEEIKSGGLTEEKLSEYLEVYLKGQNDVQKEVRDYAREQLSKLI